MIRLEKKHPVTKSYVWNATVLSVGHENFCQFWAKQASVQAKRAREKEDVDFVPDVEPFDPELTMYENILCSDPELGQPLENDLIDENGELVIDENVISTSNHESSSVDVCGSRDTTRVSINSAKSEQELNCSELLAIKVCEQAVLIHVQ